MQSTPSWAWVVFWALLLALLVVDLLAHRGGRGQSRRAARRWGLAGGGSCGAGGGWVWGWASAASCG